MFYFLSLLSGILLSLTVLLNGELSEMYGMYSSTIIIHLAGLILIAALVAAKRENPFSKRSPWYFYLGGAIGLVNLTCTNYSFSHISVSAILALGLLGQSAAALLIDRYGFLGMPKHPFHKGKLLGMVIIFGGIVSMVTNFHFLAVALSFTAGATTVLSRTLNAKLAELTSVWVSTFFNYFIGLGVSIAAFLILGGGEAVYSGFTLSPNWYIYTGGMVGMVFIYISNVIVSKISAFSLSLFLFIGQVFSGIVIDGLILGEFSSRILIGGVLVSAGLGVDLFFSHKLGGKKV